MENNNEDRMEIRYIMWELYKIENVGIKLYPDEKVTLETDLETARNIYNKVKRRVITNNTTDLLQKLKTNIEPSLFKIFNEFSNNDLLNNILTFFNDDVLLLDIDEIEKYNNDDQKYISQERKMNFIDLLNIVVSKCRNKPLDSSNTKISKLLPIEL